MRMFANIAGAERPRQAVWFLILVERDDDANNVARRRDHVALADVRRVSIHAKSGVFPMFRSRRTSPSAVAGRSSGTPIRIVRRHHCDRSALEPLSVRAHPDKLYFGAKEGRPEAPQRKKPPLDYSSLLLPGIVTTHSLSGPSAARRAYGFGATRALPRPAETAISSLRVPRVRWPVLLAETRTAGRMCRRSRGSGRPKTMDVATNARIDDDVASARNALDSDDTRRPKSDSDDSRRPHRAVRRL